MTEDPQLTLNGLLDSINNHKVDISHHITGTFERFLDFSNQTLIEFIVIAIFFDQGLRAVFFLQEYLTGTVGIRNVRGKFEMQPDTGVSFDDIAGVDAAKFELREIVDFLKEPE